MELTTILKRFTEKNLIISKYYTIWKVKFLRRTKRNLKLAQSQHCCNERQTNLIMALGSLKFLKELTRPGKRCGVK